MKFKVIDKNIDNIINKQYFLCKVNLSELIKFVKVKFKDKDFSKFNRDFDEEDGFDEERENFIFNTAIENNFICLYSENININDNKLTILSGNFYLLDGFRRLLFDLKKIKKNDDKDIYVKIYDSKTTDKNMMKLIFHFNLWKFPQGINVWLDRGWRFFIFCRLGIYLESKDYHKRLQTHFKLLKSYLDCNESRTDYYSDDYLKIYKLITGEKFYDDLILIDKIKKTEFFTEEEEAYHRKDRIYLSTMLGHLGKERFIDNSLDMKLDYFLKFLKIKVNAINKIKPMSVHGFYYSSISILMEIFVDIWKDSNKLKKLIEFNVSNIKVRKILIKDYISSLDKKIVDEFKIKKGREDSIEIMNRHFDYDGGKIYTKKAGVQDYTKYRIYLFFKDVYLVKQETYKEREFRIQKIKIPLEYGSIVHIQNEEGHIFTGTKEECLSKMEELTGTKIKLNRTRTEFIKNEQTN